MHIAKYKYGYCFSIERMCCIMKLKENNHLRETLYINTLQNGLKCYIIPKKNYVEKQAIFAVNFGSRDMHFRHMGEYFNLPQGTAHYLEHKLFEEEWGNVFDAFSKIGGQANAFTNYDMTAYYFNCTENFEQNLGLLTQFVQHPYFTNENVEKERGIISQEITMYGDHPVWRCFLNMLRSMYHNDTVKYNIAGTEESIKSITPSTLYNGYHAFYTPVNMAFIACGNIDCQKVFDDCQNNFILPPGGELERIYKDEPLGVVVPFILDKMPVSIPLFHFGFKLSFKQKANAQETSLIRVMLDLLSGQSSRFYSKLFDESLLNSNFGYECNTGNGYGHIIFAGESTDYPKVQERLLNEIRYVKQNGFQPSSFERIKKKYVGKFLKGFNSVESISIGQTENVFSGFDLFDLYENILSLDLNLLNQKVHEYFSEDRFVCSVVEPE